MKTKLQALNKVKNNLKKKKKLLLYFRGLVLLFTTYSVITSCMNEPIKPMRIGMNIWPGYEPLFLARHMKTINENDFRLVEFTAASEVVRAFRNRTLEAACVTLDETFYLIQDGLDPVIILVMDESNGADAVLASPEIKSLSELKNKRIAVEVSAVQAYVLTRCLEKASLKINKVKPVYLPVEKHISAYKNKQVDAVVTFEPFRTKLIEMGAVDLFNSSMIPGEIVDVLIVHRDYLEKNPQRIENLEKAWFKALKELKNNPHESAKIMAIREHISPEQFEKALEKIHFPDSQECNDLLKGNQPKLLGPAERLKNLMIESDLLHENISLSPLFERSETKKTK